MTPTHSNKTFERYKKQHSGERIREKQIAIETQLGVAKLAWPVSATGVVSFSAQTGMASFRTGLASFYAQQLETISKKGDSYSNQVLYRAFLRSCETIPKSPTPKTS